jgi:hypothetical protein
MADSEISNLTALTGASSATDDEYPIVDSDAAETKRQTRAELFKSIPWDKTVTAALTTGNQTINKPVGTVNFAAAASSLTVTNSLVTTSSIIITTVRTNDSTMDSVQAVPGSGSFVLYANAAATAETSVGFFVLN